jgi:hypothetical protein
LASFGECDFAGKLGPAIDEGSDDEKCNGRGMTTGRLVMTRIVTTTRLKLVIRSWSGVFKSFGLAKTLRPAYGLFVSFFFKRLHRRHLVRSCNKAVPSKLEVCFFAISRSGTASFLKVEEPRLVHYKAL